MTPESRILAPERRENAGRAALLRLLRVAMAAAIITIVILYAVDLGGGEELGGLGFVTGWPWVFLFAVTLALGVLAIDLLTPEKKVSTLSGVFLGLVAGVLASILVGVLIDTLAEVWELPEDQLADRLITLVKILIGIALTYLAVSIVLQTQDQFRLIIPYVEFSKQLRGPKPLLMDSSTLIDGRIVDLGKTGMIQGPVVVPQFVITELQRLADSSDRLKRARGRRGLDTVAELLRTPTLDVTVDETPMPGKGVDQMLVDLARAMDGMILTTDTGLDRVAQIHGVRVLNMNEIANALKQTRLPGESLQVEIIKRGEQRGQGVGYLEDGTMVVVEDGESSIGSRITATVTSAMQTAAGRLLFARIGAADSQDPEDGPSEGDSSPPEKPTDTEEQQPVTTSARHKEGPSPGPTGPERPRRERDPSRTRARNPRRG